MPMYNRAEVATLAAKYGFQRDTFEKVLRLKTVLEFFQEEKILKEHFVLKGGTSINLTIFPLPRLSVDIDMDYIPNDSKENMLATRRKITSVVKEYMESEGYNLSSDSRFGHNLDAFYFRYQNAVGNRDVMKIELNYSLRVHVLEPTYKNMLTDAFGDKIQLHTVHPIEIFAAKANALISRAAARDLYDFSNLVFSGLFKEKSERDLFRKTIIFYATISAEEVNRNFDTKAIDSLSFQKIRRELFPVLTNQKARSHFDIEQYKTCAKEYLKELMILTPREEEYMDCFIRGEYKPELLFSDTDILKRVETHPMALWKCAARGKD